MADQQVLPLRRRAPASGEPVATAWMKNGEMVNAFPGPPRSPEQWAKNDHDGYWSREGYSEAPLYLHPPAGVPASYAAERAAWLAWMVRTDRHHPDCYLDAQQEELFEAWKAARAEVVGKSPVSGQSRSEPAATPLPGAAPNDKPQQGDGNA